MSGPQQPSFATAAPSAFFFIAQASASFLHVAAFASFAQQEAVSFI